MGPRGSRPRQRPGPPGRQVRSVSSQAAEIHKSFFGLAVPVDLIVVTPEDLAAFKETATGSVGLSLQIGRVRAWVSKAFGFEGRKFAVQTSAAVMSVRGTKFEVAVNEKNEVRLDVREGVVGVKTVLGEEVEVGPGRALRSLLIIPDKPLDLPPGAREEI